MPTTGRFIGGLAGAATALLFSAVTAIGEEAWNYDDPAKWADSYEVCKKWPTQSPIDVKPSQATWVTRGSKSHLAGSPFGYAAPTIPLLAENNGHTVEVYAPADGANFISFNSSMNECRPGVQQPCTKVDPRRFYLQRVHFHAPSEHTLPKGKNKQVQFPLEAHFVHVSRDKPERAAVLAVMFRAGKENAALTGLVSKLSNLTGTATKYDGSIDLTQLIPPVGINGVWPSGYHYWGSLTTPPCTGGIQWFVFKDPVEASQAQIDALVTVLNPNGVKNSRPVQPLNGRNVGYYGD